MKCPNCGQIANAPDKIVAEGQQCYRCNVRLIMADPAVAERRVRARKGQVRGLIVGACLGAVAVPLLGIGGGSVGMAVAGGVAGATFGVVVGFVEGLIEGLGLAALMQDGSWLSYWAKLCAVLGFIGGAWTGASGDLVSDCGRWPVLLGGGIGGLCWGGLLGAYLGRISARREVSNRQGPTTA